MLQKQAIALNFAQGLDTKTDPWQVQFGKFLALDNSIFTTGNRLTKRNGYAELPSLPNDTFAYLTTLNDNLTAFGTSIGAYSADSMMWVTKGSIQPMQVSTLPLIHNNLNQVQADISIAANGLICTVYTSVNSGVSAYYYAIADSVTGQNIVEPTLINAGSVSGSPEVYLLGNYFVIIYTNGTSLQYISIPANTPGATPVGPVNIASTYLPSSTISWDGIVSEANNQLYVAYAEADAVDITYLTETNVALGQLPAAPTSFTGFSPNIMSLSTEVVGTNIIIYFSFGDSEVGWMGAVNSVLATIFAPKVVYTPSPDSPLLNVASAAQNGVNTVFFEVYNTYDYDNTIQTDYIGANTVTDTGTVGTAYISVRSVGLASKAFIVNGVVYYLATYQSPYQPTYFLINGTESTEVDPIVSAKLAYENGGGYHVLGLSNVVVNGNLAQTSYLYKDLIAALSNANAAGTSTVGGIYSQTGVNLGNFNFTTVGTDSAEIAECLQFSGGFLWMYDGYLPVEHNFFLWPDSVEVTTATTGGAITADEYFYQAVYEWSDNQGNIYRSAGSIPVSITTTGSTSANTVYVPTIRLTYKTENPIKITIYRWSTDQEIWYEITSIIAPVLNSTTTDYITYIDTASDASIVGNNILYTTGGVIEDINAPATNIISLFDTRLWMVDAEDQNLLWFSKQVIENVPVEMSDLLTFYIAPTTGAQGSTGPITALAPMDDKLIIFKANAIYYINGTGPDNTGANNNYSQPIFITATVGCANQQSIVFMPQGLMFQSDKGIWLLGRDLSTQYIGAPVEIYNSDLVNSAVNVPATNQVRFTLNSGITLMYDYYYSQWGTFSGVPAVSSTIWRELHTFINSSGDAYQEAAGTYVDGSEPVLMSFTTSWINPAGLQGYQRSFFFFIIGQFLSPHIMNLGIAYDYNPAITQVSVVDPGNYSTNFGSGDSQSPFGQQYTMGGNSYIETRRIFLAQHRCQSFQITMNEFYDPSSGVAPGAGFNLSGLNLVIGVSKGYKPLPSSQTIGGGTNTGGGENRG